MAVCLNQQLAHLNGEFVGAVFRQVVLHVHVGPLVYRHLVLNVVVQLKYSYDNGTS